MLKPGKVEGQITMQEVPKDKNKSSFVITYDKIFNLIIIRIVHFDKKSLCWRLETTSKHQWWITSSNCVGALMGVGWVCKLNVNETEEIGRFQCSEVFNVRKFSTFRRFLHSDVFYILTFSTFWRFLHSDVFYILTFWYLIILFSMKWSEAVLVEAKLDKETLW